MGHTHNMKRHPMTTVVAAAWIVAIFLAGLFYGATSALSWTLLGGFAFLPLLGILWLWNTPRESMSEAIQKALR